MKCNIKIKFICFLIFIFVPLTALASDDASTENNKPADIKIEDNYSADSLTEFEVFCDLKCPYCAKFFTNVFAGAKYHHKELKFEFKHMPFGSHHGAEELAKFYEAALLQDRSLRNDLIESIYLFRGQKDIDQLVFALSALHALDFQQIKRDMSARDVELAILEAKQTVYNRAIDSTPTVFYRGKKLSLDSIDSLAKFVVEHSQTTNPTDSKNDTKCNSCENKGVKNE